MTICGAMRGRTTRVAERERSLQYHRPCRIGFSDIHDQSRLDCLLEGSHENYEDARLCRGFLKRLLASHIEMSNAPSPPVRGLKLNPCQFKYGGSARIVQTAKDPRRI